MMIEVCEMKAQGLGATESAPLNALRIGPSGPTIRSALTTRGVGKRARGCASDRSAIVSVVSVSGASLARSLAVVWWMWFLRRLATCGAAERALSLPFGPFTPSEAFGPEHWGANRVGG
jgi:hypothetical protein